jgi:hypothetical protein
LEKIEDVINVTYDKIIQLGMKKSFVKKCIRKTKGHHNILKMAIACMECVLPFVILSNTHQVVCTMQVNLGVHLGMIELKSKVVNFSY